jgi:osmotically-inducible protein OsmY
MGERQRFQSRFERERGQRDYEDRRPSQSWNAQEDRPDGGRYAGYYADRQFGTRGVDEQEQGSRYGAHDAWNQRSHEERQYEGDRGYGREASYFGYGRDARDRDRPREGYEPWAREREPRTYPSAYETQSQYRARPSYSTPYASPEYARAYSREHYGEGRQERHDDESLGQQLRETTQRIARSVKRVFRGPKGYKRSDDRIREDVSDRLGDNEYLDCSEVEVSVSNGEVTLTGSVLSRQEKFLAEEIADDVTGVSDVHNQLRVKRAQTTQANDTGASAQLEALRARNARA